MDEEMRFHLDMEIRKLVARAPAPLPGGEGI
jgi:hypothetical protein